MYGHDTSAVDNYGVFKVFLCMVEYVESTIVHFPLLAEGKPSLVPSTYEGPVNRECLRGRIAAAMFKRLTSKEISWAMALNVDPPISILAYPGLAQVVVQ